jgi:cyclopropane-fatty-acyl-phospholipid synthase
MNQQPRGRHLVAADRGFAAGGGLLARLFGRGFHHVLDRIDAGLVEGGIDATLPDGSHRILGGRAPGPMPVVRLHSWRALVRLMRSGSVGWYKAWALGEWSSPDPVPLFDLFMRNGESLGDVARAKGLFRLVNWLAHRFRHNSKDKARENIAFHYDLGNDFYSAWLDPSMTYSSALFSASLETFEEGQARKIHALLGRLQLKPGQRLLEIGCGWGSLAEIAARDYGVEVVGLTLSSRAKGFRRCADEAGRPRQGLHPTPRLPGRGRAVRCRRQRRDGGGGGAGLLACLPSDHCPRPEAGGRAALQLISIREPLFESYAASADFIQTYIFPGGDAGERARFSASRLEGLSWQDRTASA